MTVVNMAAAAASMARYGCKVKAPLRYDVVPGGGSKPGASGDEGTFSIDIVKVLWNVLSNAMVSMDERPGNNTSLIGQDILGI